MYTQTGKQRRHLRALAHPLKPVVQVGHQGLTEAVLEQIEAQLGSHEIIKIKLTRECPGRPAEMGATVSGGARAEIVQIVGRTLTVYRPFEEEPVIRLPA